MKLTKVFRQSLISLVAMVAISGCGSNNNSHDDDKLIETNLTQKYNDIIRPYQRVAILTGTENDIERIALTIANYVVMTDEKAVLNFPSNWVIAGANPHSHETYDGDADLLHIPVDTGTKVYKSRVIEFCNGMYAKQAINTGQQRGSALPCEVSVHSDGKNVYVDMLNADAIFTLFFPNTPDPEGQMKSMANAVNSEIRTMIMASLINEPSTQESIEKLGPQFTENDVKAINESDIYIVRKYQNKDNKVFTADDAHNLARTIIEKMGTDEANADVNIEGLSENSKWRTARVAPLDIPGVFVTEACSPTYAKMATLLGAEYITALPCEITTYLDRTDTSNRTIAISILNPHFMFQNMFKGAIPNAVVTGILTLEGAKKYETLASTVLADLNIIANEAIQSSNLELLEKK
ncbi:MAG: DUF302 domain-containing protein [Sulfurovum sp.]|nr:DUF302 domain-containing protein [Sulfurovaceae bacterium]